jgi:diguanylate cyclase (GGDEF)-like protein/PAS domain S-box-containing protein
LADWADHPVALGAIVDALPAHVALVDAGGTIIAVNEAWRRYAMASNLKDPRFGVGSSYLGVCETARGPEAQEASVFAAGLRQVLRRDVREFVSEYPCPSPTGLRWFQVRVTAYGEGEAPSAVVMHIDITDRKSTELALRASHADFNALADSLPQIVWITRPDGGNIFFNKKWIDYTGLSLEESLGDGWRTPVHPDDLEAGVQAWREANELGGDFSVESRVRRADGAYRWWLVRGSPQRDADGAIVKWFGASTDIHDIKSGELEQLRTNIALLNGEIRLKRVNRVRALLGAINAAVIRVRDRTELCAEACRICVEEGGFRMALFLQVGDDGMLAPTASAGMDEAYLTAAVAVMSSSRAARTVAARALAERRPVTSNDALHDSDLTLPEHYGSRGVRSLAALPLTISGKATAVIVLYAAEDNAFKADEISLLTELFEHLAFGVEHIEKLERIERLAFFDECTGLANRNLFLSRLKDRINNSDRLISNFCVGFIDIDRFKNINDTFGREAGDSLLRQVADWLKTRTGDDRRLARVGPDQFAFVTRELIETIPWGDLLSRDSAAFDEHAFELSGATFRASAKLGLAIFPGDGADAAQLLDRAEVALKRAKKTGKRFLAYERSMTDGVAERVGLESKMRSAVTNEEFVLHFQPKTNLATGALTGAEALIRWNDPENGLTLPGRFIPVLEETGLIHQVGRWALRTALADYLRWKAAGLPAVRIAVNVSSLQLRSDDFIPDLRRILEAGGADAAQGLGVELTESVLMEDVARGHESLIAIRDMGLEVAIDDFGTGFSSLSYLAKLPMDTLKIDRSFVSEVTSGSQGRALVSMIIRLGQSMDLKVVAEGVETEDEARLVATLGCDEGQGYFFGRPVCAAEFEAAHLRRSSLAA